MTDLGESQSASFTGFTFEDGSSEIKGLKAWYHPAGASGNGIEMSLVQNSNQWTWSPGQTPPQNINGIYFQVSNVGSAGPWSPTYTVGWVQDKPNRISQASITCMESGNSGYTFQESVTSSPPPPS